VAVFAHELIHAINNHTDNAAYLARNGALSAGPWSNQEEELAIKARVFGANECATVSECHVLRELKLPLRWGHQKSSGTVTAEQIRNHYPAEFLS